MKCVALLLVASMQTPLHEALEVGDQSAERRSNAGKGVANRASNTRLEYPSVHTRHMNKNLY